MENLVHFVSRLQISILRKEKSLKFKNTSSIFILNFLDILQKEGWISFYKINKINNKLNIEVIFRFNHDRINVIKSIRLLAHNNKASFISPMNAWKINKGQGTLVLTTSQGLLTDMEARRLNLGGKAILIVN